VGALLFWGVVQGAFLLPSRVPVPGQPWPEFLIPPAAGVLLNMAVAAAFVWWFAARPAVRADARRRATYRLREGASSAAPWIVPAALSMIAVVMAALLVLPRIRPIPEEQTFLDDYLRLPLGPAAVFVMVAVIAPLLEEFLFRGWMQRTLERRLGAWPAIAITASAFGLVHADLFGLPLRIAFGAASGYLAWRTRSIWPSVVLHGAYNGSLVILSGALPQVNERTLTAWAHTDAIFYPALGALALAGSALAWSVRRMGAAAHAARFTRRPPAGAR
jgi:membrane protease YdiL (CAAX protease family)